MSIRSWLDSLTGRGLLRQAVEGITRLETNVTTIKDGVQRIRAAVDTLLDSNDDKVSKLEESLAEERAAASRLAAAEAAEDVEQNQALADAQAKTDAAISDVKAGSDDLDKLASELESLAGGGDGDGEAEPDVDTPEQEQPPAKPETPPQA